MFYNVLFASEEPLQCTGTFVSELIYIEDAAQASNVPQIYIPGVFL